MSKTILVTGKNGQIGQHLIKYFQENHPEFKVVGTARYKSYDEQPLIYDDTKVVSELLELTDSLSIENCIKKHIPDYIFHTAAIAFVGDSWNVPRQHFEVNTIGTLNLLEAVRQFAPNCNLVSLGSSEEFSCVIGDDGDQDETTLLKPRSPYAASKVAARNITDIYRNSHGLKAVQVWNFNTESEIRGFPYLTRKVSMAVARIMLEMEDEKDIQPLFLGNLNSFRSWQHSEDVADALWKVANQSDDPKEWKPYVICENDTHSIREFVEESFDIMGIKGEWEGEGLKEQFVDSDNNILVKISEEFFRPDDVTFLSGSSNLIRKELNWEPKVNFKELVKRMVESDYKLLQDKA